MTYDCHFLSLRYDEEIVNKVLSLNLEFLMMTKIILRWTMIYWQLDPFKIARVRWNLCVETWVHPRLAGDYPQK